MGHPNWREIVEYVIKFKLSDEMENWKVLEWQIRGYNYGFDGASLTELSDLLIKNPIPKETGVVIIVEGGDLDLHFPTPTEYLNSVEKLCGLPDLKKVPIVYCGPLPTNSSQTNLKMKPYVEAVVSAEFNKNFTYIDLFNLYQKFDLSKFYTFVSPHDNVELGIKIGDIDYVHPNQFGNAYLAKVILSKEFEITFDPEEYIADVNNGKMFPKY